MRTSSFSEMVGSGGGKVDVGFRPSGELHVGNLFSIASAAVLASETGSELKITCCDTDWDAHTHDLVREGNKFVMEHFFQREDPYGCCRNIAEHRFSKAVPYIESICGELGVEYSLRRMSELQKKKGFRDALRELMLKTPEFDGFWGGRFRARWKSPVSPVCECGFSPAKGASYAEKSDSFVFPCWNKECSKGFHETGIYEESCLGVYYLVDPVRDTSSENTSIHVFGGDYRKASKGQKTSKIEKVEKVTELANGETPDYFIAPLIVEKSGKPLSKSKNTGIFLDELPKPSVFSENFVGQVEKALEQGRKAVVMDKLV